MSDGGLDLDLVISEDSALTIPSAELARLHAVPGQRVRVRIEKAPARRRSLLGALATPGRPILTIEDFDALSDQTWDGTDYRSDPQR